MLIMWNRRVDCDRCDSSTFVTPPTAPIPGLGVLGAGCFRISYIYTRARYTGLTWKEVSYVSHVSWYGGHMGQVGHIKTEYDKYRGKIGKLMVLLAQPMRTISKVWNRCRFLGRRYWFLKKSASPQNFSASYFSLDALFWTRSVSYFAATDRLPHTLPHSFSYDSSSFLEKIICLVTFSRTYLYIGWNRSKSLLFFLWIQS